MNEIVKGKHGGARKGAGKPKGRVANHTLLAQEMRKMMIETLHARFKPILEAQIDSAIGVTTEKYDRKTGELFYKEETPNTNAAKFLTEQALGKPKEFIEHSGNIGGIAELVQRLDNE